MVHLVDDEDAIRDSLAWLLKSRGIASVGYASGEAFLEAWRQEMRGIVILDIRMQGLSGLEVLDRLVARGAQQPIVILSGHGDVPAAVSALKNGAVDFLEKPFNDNQMVDRVIELLALEATRHAARISLGAVQDRLASLSEREREVMELMIKGRLNKQIAGDLGIAMRTVEVHRARVLDKMGVRNGIELTALLVRSGK
ncbi:MAG: DNA-binding response regulator [Rhizobiales bacterium PAR1]|nr:MAG: DNA-binding response regulator [Rhizobiales bacterium PAR1]